MTLHVDPITRQATQALDAAHSHLDIAPRTQQLGHAHGAHAYPRLANHEGIMIRTNAIVDNLDEVLMLPQSFVFPLRQRQQKAMRRKVDKSKTTDNANLGKRKRDQEDKYEDMLP